MRAALDVREQECHRPCGFRAGCSFHEDANYDTNAPLLKWAFWRGLRARSRAVQLRPAHSGMEAGLALRSGFDPASILILRLKLTMTERGGLLEPYRAA